MTPSLGPGWYRVAGSDEIGTDPRAVDAGGVAYTAFRSRPGRPASVVAPRCPHRGVQLSHAGVEGERLRCPYHGWEFGPDGACVLVPSQGPQVAPPPRADLATPWGVCEQDGVLWVAPRDPAAGAAPEPAAGAAPQAAGGTARDPVGPRDPADLHDTFGNCEPALAHAWHPVALERELPEVGGHQVRLLGRSWTLSRSGGGVRAEPEPAGLTERYGMLWLAPRPSRVELIELPDDVDEAFIGDWLEPERTASPAGLMADNFLDVAHFPFVHAGTFGAAEEPVVSAYEVEPEPGGFRSVQEQWFDNPEDPAVATGERDVRQRRRVTYRYRVPFQLSLRMHELDAGAVKTILFLLQPEDVRSTRVYTKLLLHGIGGVPVPPPEVVRREMDFEVAVLAEDLALQHKMGDQAGLPLRMRDELHVRADRCGIALRRALTAFRAGT